LLEHDEKWRARNQEVPTKSEKSNNSCSPIGDEHVEYDSDDEDKNGRRHGGLKKGDCCWQEGVQGKKMGPTQRNGGERTAAEVRRAMADERRAAAEEQRAAVEERRVAAKEEAKRLEQEQRIVFMDPLNFDEKGRAYFELMCDQVLASRSGLFMGGFMRANGGFSGFGPNGANGSFTGGGGKWWCALVPYLVLLVEIYLVFCMLQNFEFGFEI
jgi:hypothetical protein